MDTDAEALERQAWQLVEAQQFKEAIACYRQLWLQDDSPRWRQAMAQCHLAQGRQFARRAMYRQAIEQWRQYRQLAESGNRVPAEVILWQLGDGDVDTAEALLSQLDAGQLDNEIEFSRILALLVMSRYPVLRNVLPENSRFVLDLKIVESALSSLPDEAACLDGLQTLPKHSAFRDIADFVQTVLSNDVSTPIESESLLYSCSRIAPVLRLQGAQFVRSLSGLNDRQRQLVYQLRNLQPEQRQFIERYREHQEDSDNIGQFDLVMQFKSLTGAEAARVFCQATLPNDFIRWLRFKQQFPQCSAFDLCRLKALACERSDDYRAAEQHWLDAVDRLSGDVENRLKIALILRHIAGFYPPEQQLPWLKESLQYDPEDIETQEKLARLEPQAFLVSAENDADQQGVSGLFDAITEQQQQALWQRADQLMMAFTPEQLAQEFQAEAGPLDLEQLLARTPALMDGLLLLKAARQLELPVSVTVPELVQTVVKQ